MLNSTGSEGVAYEHDVYLIGLELAKGAHGLTHGWIPSEAPAHFGHVMDNYMDGNNGGKYRSEYAEVEIGAFGYNYATVDLNEGSRDAGSPQKFCVMYQANYWNNNQAPCDDKVTQPFTVQGSQNVKIDLFTTSLRPSCGYSDLCKPDPHTYDDRRTGRGFDCTNGATAECYLHAQPSMGVVVCPREKNQVMQDSDECYYIFKFAMGTRPKTKGYTIGQSEMRWVAQWDTNWEIEMRGGNLRYQNTGWITAATAENDKQYATLRFKLGQYSPMPTFVQGQQLIEKSADSDEVGVPMQYGTRTLITYGELQAKLRQGPDVTL